MTLTQLKYLIIGLLIVSALSTAYYQGKRTVQKDWDLSQAIIEKQIQELQTKQAEITTKVVTEYVDRTKIVKQKGDTIIEYVDKYVSKDDTCVIPNNVISLLNSAMQNDIPGIADITNENPSEFTVADITHNTATNYGICNEYREQIESLQQWIGEQNAVK